MSLVIIILSVIQILTIGLVLETLIRVKKLYAEYSSINDSLLNYKILGQQYFNNSKLIYKASENHNYISYFINQVINFLTAVFIIQIIALILGIIFNFIFQ